MRTALLADIHANREAMSACLAHAEQQQVDRYLLLGDYVGYGADPGWVVDRVKTLCGRGAVALLGNHDAAALGGAHGMNPIAAEAIEWTRTRLDAAQCEFLGSLPLIASEGDYLFVHANAHNPAGWHYILGRRDAANDLQAGDQHAIFCGHVHVPALYHMSQTGKISEFTPVAGVEIPLLRRRQWLAVIGAVGQPRDHDPAACYAILDSDREVLTYIRVPYDVESAARKILAAGLPAALALRLEHGS
jgi:diadenosine tetraphosphatase ApaH/serine/threonine PP2A family protein phosphatase